MIQLEESVSKGESNIKFIFLLSVGKRQWRRETTSRVCLLYLILFFEGLKFLFFLSSEPKERNFKI